jgi:hypothetical protein
MPLQATARLHVRSNFKPCTAPCLRGSVGHKRMEKTLAPIVPMVRASRRRAIVICTLIAMYVGVLVAGVIMFSRAKATANRVIASGRLSQMATALWIYEYDHGTLPPLCLRDKLGTPLQSWRALILPHLGSPELPKQRDLSQPWNSDFNRRLTDAVPPGNWVWFALERPTIVTGAAPGPGPLPEMIRQHSSSKMPRAQLDASPPYRRPVENRTGGSQTRKSRTFRPVWRPSQRASADLNGGAQERSGTPSLQG